MRWSRISETPPPTLLLSPTFPCSYVAIRAKIRWEQARVALERRSPKVLAAFILSSIDAPNGSETMFTSLRLP